MTKSRVGLVGLLGLVLVFAAGGCSSNGGGADGGGGTGGGGGMAGAGGGGTGGGGMAGASGGGTGGGGTGGGGTGGGGSAMAQAVASCNAWCDAYAAASCADPLYPTASECKATECVPTGAPSAACLAAIKTLYDCSRTQANICADNGCVSQASAAFTACR